MCADLLGYACPASASLSGTVCDPLILGRSLLACANGSVCLASGKCSDGHTCGTPPPFAGGATSCNPNPSGTTTTYGEWIKNSLILFTDEDPKFALRAAFLNDVYTRAQDFQNITLEADTALHNFFKTCTGCAEGTCSNNKCDDGSFCGESLCTNGTTCSGPGTCTNGGPCNQCADGGPVAQLEYARGLGNPARSLPNAVIYGWVDPAMNNGQTLPGTLTGLGGYSHLVKVTAFSPGRDGNATYHISGLQPILPWVNSWTTFFYQKYGLANRDGNVYVSIKRWDQDHDNTTNFPNGHLLWKFMFHNPNLVAGRVQPTGIGPLSGCTSTYPGSADLPFSVGFGIQSQTLQGMQLPGHALSTTDKNLLAGAFMLNDVGTGAGTGQIDPNAVLDPNYENCVNTVETLLQSGTESHACARYSADINCADDPSGNGGRDYCLKFIDCNSIDNSTPVQAPP